LRRVFDGHVAHSVGKRWMLHCGSNPRNPSNLHAIGGETGALSAPSQLAADKGVLSGANKAIQAIK
jgi:hypothetical protein